jgi:hypothetical protein
MIFWGQTERGLPLFYFSREGADIGICAGGQLAAQEGLFGKYLPILGLMPYLYALIKAAEREAVLCHPHAMEGFGMGEGFAGLMGTSAHLPPTG